MALDISYYFHFIRVTQYLFRVQTPPPPSFQLINEIEIISVKEMKENPLQCQWFPVKYSQDVSHIKHSPKQYERFPNHSQDVNYAKYSQDVLT